MHLVLNLNNHQNLIQTMSHFFVNAFIWSLPQGLNHIQCYIITLWEKYITIIILTGSLLSDQRIIGLNVECNTFIPCNNRPHTVVLYSSVFTKQYRGEVSIIKAQLFNFKIVIYSVISIHSRDHNFFAIIFYAAVKISVVTL